MVAAIAPVWAQVAWLNKYVPVAEAAVLIGVLVAVKAAVFVFSFADWVLTKLHILGGSAD